ncbi:MAG TPA: ECF transporter S component [Bacillota bacterium]|nr:ECF transporter S component [Bacillota bacterium]HPA53876.1 ECF transporter S component [Bacillota bacterium]HPX69020.1 ECF transporter S component [Bacillota bacterium]HQA65494.1 ECF transporter S component [Bacillota bacterium]HQO43226.1 ECF transporter S component [Bacillota bacterium]
MPMIRFETKKQDPRELVLISMLAAIAAISRILFAPLPNFKPMSFVIIVTGIVFGPESGFMVGSVSAILSNIFFGQGPWTLLQMLAWGLMGLTAGLLRNTVWIKSRYGILMFGFSWGFIFGWIMDAWYIIGFIRPLSLMTIIGGLSASFYFDLMHALANTFFLGIFSKSWIKLFNRIKIKYGLLEDS